MGEVISPGVNISSVLLGVSPGDPMGAREHLLAMDGVEVHAVAEDGRMIVTIETPSEGSTVEIFEVIRQLPGVLSASLVFHQYETDPDEEV
ncbi:MAG: chaperone NapD [Azonexus sp.]|nr:chaperone NapD [Azonexus sp.]